MQKYESAVAELRAGSRKTTYESKTGSAVLSTVGSAMMRFTAWRAGSWVLKLFSREYVASMRSWSSMFPLLSGTPSASITSSYVDKIGTSTLPTHVLAKITSSCALALHKEHLPTA
jgi:hypothetical protein